MKSRQIDRDINGWREIERVFSSFNSRAFRTSSENRLASSKPPLSGVCTPWNVQMLTMYWNEEEKEKRGGTFKRPACLGEKITQVETQRICLFLDFFSEGKSRRNVKNWSCFSDLRCTGEIAWTSLSLSVFSSSSYLPSLSPLAGGEWCMRIHQKHLRFLTFAILAPP